MTEKCSSSPFFFDILGGSLVGRREQLSIGVGKKLGLESGMNEASFLIIDIVQSFFFSVKKIRFNNTYNTLRLTF